MTKKFQIPSDHRYLETEFLVHDCDHDRKRQLWAEWHDRYGVPWDDEGRGDIVTIGHLDKRPIVVWVWWAFIGGGSKRVAFVDGCSQLVDYKMVEDWYGDVFPNAQTSNATNFHNIIGGIQRAMGVKTIMRYDPTKIRNAIYEAQRTAHTEGWMMPEDKK